MGTAFARVAYFQLLDYLGPSPVKTTWPSRPGRENTARASHVRVLQTRRHPCCVSVLRRTLEKAAGGFACERLPFTGRSR